MQETSPSPHGSAIGNLPNFLSLSRIASVPLICWLLTHPGEGFAQVTTVVFLAATLTDAFDGYFARRYGQVTALGKLLDPLADKLLVVSALVMLAMLDRAPGIPAWLVVVVIGRELAVTGLRSIAAAEGIVLGAEAVGKFKMIVQAVALHALILHYTYLGLNFHAAGIALLAASAVLGLWSAVQYYRTVYSRLVGGASA